jgi:hypothetical protein
MKTLSKLITLITITTLANTEEDVKVQTEGKFYISFVKVLFFSFIKSFIVNF